MSGLSFDKCPMIMLGADNGANQMRGIQKFCTIFATFLQLQNYSKIRLGLQLEDKKTKLELGLGLEHTKTLYKVYFLGKE